MIYSIGNIPLPPRSTLAKSLPASGGAWQKAQQADIPTQADFDRAKDILCRCVREGKIDLMKSSMISSDMQKSMATGRPMKPEFYDFLVRESGN